MRDRAKQLISKTVIGGVIAAAAILVWPFKAVSTDARLGLEVEGPKSVFLGEVVIATVRLTNRSEAVLRVRQPSPAISLQAELTGGNASSQVFAGDPSPERRSYKDLAPGESLTTRLSLPALSACTASGEVSAQPGAYTLAVTYATNRGAAHQDPAEWAGKLGPVPYSFRVVLPDPAEGELARAIRAQDSSLDRERRANSFQQRTKSLTLLRQRYRDSRLTALAFSKWEAEGRFLERYADVEGVAQEISEGKDPVLARSARESLADIAATKGDWFQLSRLVDQLEEPAKGTYAAFLANKTRLRLPTLNDTLGRMANEKAQTAESVRRLKEHGRLAAEARSRVNQRLRALQAALQALPAAPGEERLALTGPEIRRRIQDAVSRGEVADGMSFGVDTPLEDPSTYRERLEVQRLEKVLAARKRFATREQDSLTEHPTHPLLKARALAAAEERSLAPLSGDEHKRLESEWKRVSEDGDVTILDYEAVRTLLVNFRKERQGR